jgi:hypothetical protein
MSYLNTEGASKSFDRADPRIVGPTAKFLLFFLSTTISLPALSYQPPSSNRQDCFEDSLLSPL